MLIRKQILIDSTIKEKKGFAIRENVFVNKKNKFLLTVQFVNYGEKKGLAIRGNVFVNKKNKFLLTVQFVNYGFVNILCLHLKILNWSLPTSKTSPICLFVFLRFYVRWIKPQPRFILSAMSLNDIATGILVTSFGVYPALFECWPLGQALCQLQVQM